jgi:DNA modification methylase
VTVYHETERVALHHGNCLDVLRADVLGYDHRLGYAPPAFPDASVDAVVTDPPYGLEFMGKDWDGADGFRRSLNTADAGRDNVFGRTSPEYRALHTFQQWCEQWAAECLRVLKPGGYLFAFGGARTYHRLTSGIEDAGFEIRESIAWLYGQGFPKSLDVSKAIDQAAGAEREVLSEGVPLKRMIPGADQNRTGSWIKDNGRIYVPVETAPATEDAARWQGWATALKPAFEPVVVARKPLAGTVVANVLEYGTGALNIDACRIATSDDLGGGAYAKDGGRGVSDSLNPSGMNRPGATAHGEYVQPSGRWPTNVVLDDTQAAELDQQTGTTRSTKGKPRTGSNGDGWGMTATGAEYDDQGGASRFFPVFRYEAKAATSERPRCWVHDCACEHDTPMPPLGACATCGMPGKEIAHPTVKPLDFMRWLIRLVTQPGGVVLEPFAGSGTTVEACIQEKVTCIAIEQEADYLPLIMHRINRRLDPVAAVKETKTADGPATLFDDLGEAS